MERPVPIVPGHTAWSLIDSTTSAAIGVAFIHNDQEVDGLDCSGSLKVGGKIDPPLVDISSDDSVPCPLVGDTSSSSGVQVISSDPDKKRKFLSSQSIVCKEATNSEVKIMVKQMAHEMLSSLKVSQNQTKVVASNAGKGYSSIFQEYISDSFEIDCNRFNEDGKLNRFRKVKCNLCNSAVVSWANFSTHMRNFHLPEEMCQSCGENFPARDILNHRRKCSRGKEVITEGSELLEIKGSLKKSQNEVFVSDETSDIDDDNHVVSSNEHKYQPEVSSAVEGGSGATSFGSEAWKESLESTDTIGMLLDNSLVTDKAEANNGNKIIPTLAESKDPGLKGSSAEEGGLEATRMDSEALEKGLKAVPVEIIATVGIRMLFGDKAYSLIVPRKKPIKSAMKKMAGRLGQQVSCLAFTLEGGKKLKGQELMGELEGKDIEVTQV